MAAQTFGDLLVWLVIVAIVVAIAVHVLRWLYRRSTKEVALVAPGFSARRWWSTAAPS